VRAALGPRILDAPLLSGSDGNESYLTVGDGSIRFVTNETIADYVLAFSDNNKHWTLYGMSGAKLATGAFDADRSPTDVLLPLLGNWYDLQRNN
jgi:hypothetical protein